MEVARVKRQEDGPSPSNAGSDIGLARIGLARIARDMNAAIHAA
jgi:hypothetical protein